MSNPRTDVRGWRSFFRNGAKLLHKTAGNLGIGGRTDRSALDDGRGCWDYRADVADAGTARPVHEGGQGMTEIQGWILIAMVVIVIFSQWYVAKK